MEKIFKNVEKDRKIPFCATYKITGKCPRKNDCPSALGHRRCRFFLYGKCDNLNCPFYHDPKERVLLFKEDYCKSFKLIGQCPLGKDCKFAYFHKNCRYLIEGTCTKGENCHYFHPSKKGIIQESPIKPAIQEVCKYYIKSTCTQGKNCKYLHTCPFNLTNSCKYGNKCKYSHEKPENTVKKMESNDYNNDDEFDKSSMHSFQSIKDISTTCCICYDNKATHATVPCGHKIYCIDCIVQLTYCAKCRQKIESIIKIFD